MVAVFLLTVRLAIVCVGVSVVFVFFQAVAATSASATAVQQQHCSSSSSTAALAALQQEHQHCTGSIAAATGALQQQQCSIIASAAPLPQQQRPWFLRLRVCFMHGRILGHPSLGSGSVSDAVQDSNTSFLAPSGPGDPGWGLPPGAPGEQAPPRIPGATGCPKGSFIPYTRASLRGFFSNTCAASGAPLRPVPSP